MTLSTETNSVTTLAAIVFVLCLCGCGGKGFQVKGGKAVLVTYVGNGLTVTEIQGADPATFKPLGPQTKVEASYAVDANQAYMSYINLYMPIPTADSETFVILTADGAYTKDKNRAYWYGVEIDGADPATFRIIKEPYTADADDVYVGIEPLGVTSLEDFEVLLVATSDQPVKNENNRTIIKEKSSIDLACWSRDGKRYYWGVTPLETADYESLAVLNAMYAKDDSTVFCKGEPLPGADAATFTTVGPGDAAARDKYYEYLACKRIKKVE